MHWDPFIGQLKTTVDKSTFLVEKVVGENAEIVTPVNAARSRTNPNVACHLKKNKRRVKMSSLPMSPEPESAGFFKLQILTSN
jgi:hypothetical protein